MAPALIEGHHLIPQSLPPLVALADFFDLVLCLDRELYEEILAGLPQEHFEFYRKKVVLLTTFSEYESEGIMLARGGLALLPSQLSWILRGGYSESKRVSARQFQERLLSVESPR